MNNIIISQNKSRFLDNLKIAMYHHKDDINTYTIDIKEIFKAYDIIKPVKIYVNQHDYETIEVKSFIEQANEKEKSLFVVDNGSFLNVVNTEIFREYNTERNNYTAILLDNVESDIPPNIKKMCESNNIIHMFNNPNIKNPYNLGTLLEHQKAFIFSSYKYIITKDKLYKNEAILCGAKHIDMDSENYETVSTQDKIIDIKEYIREELYGIKS